MYWQLYFVVAAGAIASALSARIAIRTAGVRTLPGCGEGSGCDAVMTSRWSQLGMFPVARLAVAVYALLAILALIARSNRHTQFLQASVLCFAMISVGSALWFLLLQLAVVRRWCSYCNAVHLLGVLGLASAIWAIHPSPTQLRTATGVATIAVATLIAGQLVLRPRGYAIVPSSTASLRASLVPQAPSSGGESTTTTNASGSSVVSQRQVWLLDKRVRLNVGEWPMFGNEGAKRFFAYIFDYTCPPCRAVHEMVSQVSAADPELGVLLLPLPQHPACNPEVKEIAPGRGYACQYARLGLAVWHSCPERYKEFDEFLLDGAEPPPIGLAVGRAIKLCGRALDPHRPDEATEQAIRKAIDLYRGLQIKKVPTLLLPHAQVAGQLRSLAELKSVLARELYRRPVSRRSVRLGSTTEVS